MMTLSRQSAPKPIAMRSQTTGEFHFANHDGAAALSGFLALDASGWAAVSLLWSRSVMRARESIPIHEKQMTVVARHSPNRVDVRPHPNDCRVLLRRAFEAMRANG